MNKPIIHLRLNPEILAIVDAIGERGSFRDLEVSRSSILRMVINQGLLHMGLLNSDKSAPIEPSCDS